MWIEKLEAILRSRGWLIEDPSPGAVAALRAKQLAYEGKLDELLATLAARAQARRAPTKRGARASTKHATHASSTRAARAPIKRKAASARTGPDR